MQIHQRQGFQFLHSSRLIAHAHHVIYTLFRNISRRHGKVLCSQKLFDSVHSQNLGHICLFIGLLFRIRKLLFSFLQLFSGIIQLLLCILHLVKAGLNLFLAGIQLGFSHLQLIFTQGNLCLAVGKFNGS